MQDFDEICGKFRTSMLNLNHQIRLFHVSAYDIDDIETALGDWPLRAMDVAKKCEKIMDMVGRAIDWLVSLDIAQLTSREIDVSATTGSSVATHRRGAITYGGEIIDLLHIRANDAIARINDHDAVIQYLRDAFAHCTADEALSPIASQIARRFIPIIGGAIGEEFRAKLRTMADAQLGVSMIAWREDRAVYDQLFATNYLVPIRLFPSFEALFAMFAIYWDGAENARTNFAKLAKAQNCAVVCVSKVSRDPRVIEFDSRPLFDEAFIANVAVPAGTGVCDKIIARFDTFHERDRAPDNAMGDAQIIIERGVSPERSPDRAITSKVLVIETIDGKRARIMVYKPRIIDRYFVAPQDCEYLLEGQSTRSAQYNEIIAREIEQHLVDHRDAASAVRMFVNIDEEEKRRELSATIGTRLESYLRQYRDSAESSGPQIKNIIRAILPIEMWDRETTDQPMLRAKLCTLAHSIARKVRARIMNVSRETIDAAFITQLVADLELGEMCVKSVSLYGYLQKISMP